MLILRSYGSGINGLINSIKQFLGCITFLEMGVGAVVQTAFYKPLADKNNRQLSEITVSANRFFTAIAKVMLVYISVLTIIYPLIINKQFDWIFTAILIVAMSVSTFSEYYFGITDRLLLTADQKGYIFYFTQTIVIALSTILSAILIICGFDINFVKIVASIIYLGRPIILRIYVNKTYKLNRKITYEKEPIKQKWNGIAQHIASVILTGTDTIVLTLFSSLTNVSIYSVYSLVMTGLEQLLTAMSSGIQALFGELWAKREVEHLSRVFHLVEWVVHMGVVFVFGCTTVLILPFVKVYTRNVDDANYVVPTFALLITLAHGMYCLRIPYNAIIRAANHYKQTQFNFISSAALNLIISIIAVRNWGLVGVAIGTLVAMTYQTVWMAWYNSKNLINSNYMSFVKQILTDVIEFLCAYRLSCFFHCSSISYASWIVLAIKIVILWLFVLLLVNTIIYRDNVKKAMLIIKKKAINK
ncbi:lipopolysaccharide biosynthesis protein [uncultured Ruminococcus sp.]|uniref:lipopolysaccharide biosynthesis protein n=1 Tax=uncultured Ruminococcus sp. TaxID=165186 RepID=UPI0026602885|nr:polysaccharide biosynthesis C-terminal domain-containing protein [uncultured Ruminococcus sp.]